MADINNFVEVTIRLQTGGITTVGFGTTLIAAPHAAYSDRFKLFSSLAEAEQAGLEGDHGALNGLAWKALQTAFLANPKPSLVAVGRVQVDALTTTVLNAVVGRVYSARVNGTLYSYTAILGDTAISISIALAALVDADAAVTVAVPVTSTFTVVAAVAGTFFSYSVSDHLSAAASVTENYDDALTAVQAVSDLWYGLTIVNRTSAVQEDVATWAQANASVKFFRAATADADVVNTTPAADTTTIAAIVKALGYTRSSVIYHTKATGDMNDEFIDVAWSVMALGFNPDIETATDKFKTLPGVIADVLTSTQRANAIGTEELPFSGKHANVYTSVSGRSITQSGLTASGDWCDLILGADWLKTRIEERVFLLFVNSKKVPYTRDGILGIVGEIRGQLKIGQNTQFLAFDEALDKVFGYAITFPDIRGVPTINKTARLLQGISFQATAAGAIHAAKPIIGTIVP